MISETSSYLHHLIASHSGWLPLRDFIHACLYAPGLGYYVSGTRKFSDINHPDAGDFITAPELSPLFAQTWAKVFAGNHPQPFDILEFGGGSGKFAAQVLSALGAMNHSPEHYRILEVSGELRERQKMTIQKLAPEAASRVEWLDALPGKLSGAVFMNEVLDAIAPRVLVRKNGQWFKRGVIEKADAFQFEDRPLQDEALIQLAESRAGRDDDVVLEYNESAEALMKTLAESMRVSKKPASLYLCDYGFERVNGLPEEYRNGSLRGFYRNRLVDDILTNCGEMDITSTIDFVAIFEAAQGLALKSFETQREFLIRNGILQMLEKTGSADGKEFIKSAEAVKMLVAPDAMGNAFKVLILERHNA